jgi:tetratricopeptide (TPR) repeat protein
MELVPGSLLYRSNYALYAMYAGDFASAARVAEAIVKEEPGSYTAYVPLAVAQIGAGNLDAARSTYERMAATGTSGSSAATTGLADLALYQGRPADARAVLVKSIPDDQKAENTAELIAKHYAMAEACLQEGNKPAARAAAVRARALGSGEDALVPAVHLGLASEKDAAAAAELLGKQVAAQSRAYGKIVEGEAALAKGKPVAAVDALRAAIKFADLWLARYDLGVAYAQAGLFAEALSELEACQKRRGEATAIFFDDRPTVRYLAPLYYWLGRAKEGLKMNAAAAEDYKQFLSLRPEGSKDPLAIDARRRVTAR